MSWACQHWVYYNLECRRSQIKKETLWNWVFNGVKSWATVSFDFLSSTDRRHFLRVGGWWVSLVATPSVQCQSAGWRGQEPYADTVVALTNKAVMSLNPPVKSMLHGVIIKTGDYIKFLFVLPPLNLSIWQMIGNVNAQKTRWWPHLYDVASCADTGRTCFFPPLVNLNLDMSH